MDLRIVYRATLLFYFFFSPLICISQITVKVRADVDRNTILIGERLKLTIEADIPENQPIRFFLIDSIDHFEFIDKGKIDTINTSSGTRLRQQFVLTSFDSGRWVIPSYELDTQNAIKTDSFVINVGFLPFDTAQPYHDIKDVIPVEIEEKKKTNWYYFVAAGIIVLLILVYFFTRKKKHAPAPEILVDPFDEAMKQLELLPKQNLTPKEYYTRLTDIFRNYLAKRKNISSMQKTTDELVGQLRSLKLNDEYFQPLSQALRLCDFVKFAKYTPSAEDDRLVAGVIRNSIQVIEKMPR